ncbi:MAG: hypothetical protein ABIY52_17075 [Gemmatimonadaceae bacterium]
MTGKYLVDLTDDRFKTAQNDDVIAFIRAKNPSSHSDVGELLISFSKQVAGSHFYCPSYKSCAYVALHTGGDRIFAISYGQHAMAFKLTPGAVNDARADGGVADEEIGPDWVRFEPWHRGTVPPERLLHWTQVAFEAAANA